ncbi:hypothetical protein [Streptomyces adustus]|uniref:hypothetical protein n=1 Tax=Streptomyces adustus TaxID=1609272 RepID=UPI00192E5992|nr:hypothetical protein [Streptomyces adustus]
MRATIGTGTGTRTAEMPLLAGADGMLPTGLILGLKALERRTDWVVGPCPSVVRGAGRLSVVTLLLRFRCAGVVPALAVAAKGLPVMRVTRTMLASAAVAAAVALSAPAAHAVSLVGLRASDGGNSHGSDGEQHGKEHDHKSSGENGEGEGSHEDDGAQADGGAPDMGGDDSGAEEGGNPWKKKDGKSHEQRQAPSGGVKAGGGALAMALADDGGNPWKKKDGESHGDDNAASDDEQSQGGPNGGDQSEGDASAAAGDDSGAEAGAGEGGNPWKKGGKSHEKQQAPSGSVKAGGGGLAESGNGLAAGSLLLAGGLGAGAYMLRRRSASDAVGA